MIDELYASAECSSLSSMMVRLASASLRAAAVLLFVGDISLLFIAILGLVGKPAFYFTSMNYGQDIWFLTSAIGRVMTVSTFFLARLHSD